MQNKHHEVMKFYTIPKTTVERLINLKCKRDKLLPFNNIDYEPMIGA